MRVFTHLASAVLLASWCVSLRGADNAMAQLVFGCAAANDERFRQIGGNLGEWLYTQSLLTQGDRADLDNSAFGLAGWNDVPRYYGTGHGYDVSQFTFFCPHHQAYLQACYLWAYRHSRDRLFLDRAKNAIRLTMETYPDGWTWTNGQITLERARFILPLAWLVRLEDTPEHRAWLARIVHDLQADQVECGAIRTRIVRSPTSNEAYGTGETSLVEQNGDHVSDLLYESNFAFRPAENAS